MLIERNVIEIEISSNSRYNIHNLTQCFFNLFNLAEPLVTYSSIWQHPFLVQKISQKFIKIYYTAHSAPPSEPKCATARRLGTTDLTDYLRKFHILEQISDKYFSTRQKSVSFYPNYFLAFKRSRNFPPIIICYLFPYYDFEVE